MHMIINWDGSQLSRLWPCHTHESLHLYDKYVLCFFVRGMFTLILFTMHISYAFYIFIIMLFFFLKKKKFCFYIITLSLPVEI